MKLQTTVGMLGVISWVRRCGPSDSRDDVWGDAWDEKRLNS